MFLAENGLRNCRAKVLLFCRQVVRIFVADIYLYSISPPKMDKRIVFPLLLSLMACNLFSSQSFRYSIVIEDLTRPQEFNIPLREFEGWCTAGIRIRKNTANDTLMIGHYMILPPGKTGVIYSGDVYNRAPFVYHFKPYKATKGSVEIEWFYQE